MPTDEFYEAGARGDLAWRIAQAVKEAEREHGLLETKEIRNVVENVLRRELSLDAAHGRTRLVTKWVHHPIPDEPT